MIREIYNGDFRPLDNMGMSDDYRRKRQIASELSRRFEDKVDMKNKEGFEKVIEAHMELVLAGMEDGYTSGFTDGIKLLIEVFSR